MAVGAGLYTDGQSDGESADAQRRAEHRLTGDRERARGETGEQGPALRLGLDRTCLARLPDFIQAN